MARTSLARPNIKIMIPKVGRAAGRLARRGAGAAAAVAKDEKHTIAAVGAAAVLGYMERQGSTLPHINALGMAGTYGLVAWGAARMTKSRTAAHVATGLLSVAAYQATRTSTFFGGGAAPQQQPPQLQPVGPAMQPQGMQGSL